MSFLAEYTSTFKTHHTGMSDTTETIPLETDLAGEALDLVELEDRLGLITQANDLLYRTCRAKPLKNPILTGESNELNGNLLQSQVMSYLPKTDEDERFLRVVNHGAIHAHYHGTDERNVSFTYHENDAESRAYERIFKSVHPLTRILPDLHARTRTALSEAAHAREETASNLKSGLNQSANAEDRIELAEKLFEAAHAQPNKEDFDLGRRIILYRMAYYAAGTVVVEALNEQQSKGPGHQVERPKETSIPNVFGRLLRTPGLLDQVAKVMEVEPEEITDFYDSLTSMELETWQKTKDIPKFADDMIETSGFIAEGVLYDELVGLWNELYQGNIESSQFAQIRSKIDRFSRKTHIPESVRSTAKSIYSLMESIEEDEVSRTAVESAVEVVFEEESEVSKEEEKIMRGIPHRLFKGQACKEMAKVQCAFHDLQIRPGVRLEAPLVGLLTLASFGKAPSLETMSGEIDSRIRDILLRWNVPDFHNAVLSLIDGSQTRNIIVWVERQREILQDILKRDQT
ncbi:MAG: hypothetical protein R3313_00200 [Candidatus Saccharimonadales bacterium]|nr:hypothetical protein [Candidatus Saccharimonadales bacterium]